jgi:hypothetical protein
MTDMTATATGEQLVDVQAEVILAYEKPPRCYQQPEA